MDNPRAIQTGYEQIHQQNAMNEYRHSFRNLNDNALYETSNIDAHATINNNNLNTSNRYRSLSATNSYSNLGNLGLANYVQQQQSTETPVVVKKYYSETHHHHHHHHSGSFNDLNDIDLISMELNFPQQYEAKIL